MEGNITNLQEAIREAYKGNAVLFTGAGFSWGAKNLKGEQPRLGGSLADHLYEKCGIDESDGDLLNASDIFLDQHGSGDLISLLQEEYTIAEISDDHKLMGTIPWKRIYTTNYDDVIELSCKSAGKVLTPVTLASRLRDYENKDRLSIHLNGYIQRLNSSTLDSEFKLTNASYLATDFAENEWVELFRSDLETSRALIFVGFSCNGDLDLTRIINAANQANVSKCFFVVSPYEKQTSLARIKKFGSVYKLGLEGFSQEVKSIEKEGITPETSRRLLQSFRRVGSDHGMPKSILDRDFHDLILYGRSNDKFIHQSLTEGIGTKYYLHRSALNKVIDKLESGTKNVIVHSHLGNGKTLFLKGLGIMLETRGYPTFQFNRYYEDTDKEVEHICKSGRPHVIIVETYAVHLDLIKSIEMFRGEDTYLIVSERSIVNDTNSDKLEENFHQPHVTISLNRLQHSEVQEVIDLIDHYGLWGERAAWNNLQKIRWLEEDLKGSFRLILLEVLKSPVLKERFSNLIENIAEKPAFLDALLLILASSILDFDLTLDDLVYMLDKELLNNRSFNNHPGLNEIINFGYNTIAARSSVLAEAALDKGDYNGRMVNLLIDVMTRLNERRSNKNNALKLRSMLSHSRLQSLLNARENPEAMKQIVALFEAVKDLEYCKSNYHFWLQYAISRLGIRDYKMAKIYFDNAREFGEKVHGKTFDPFLIDNHYVRYLLEFEIYFGSPENCIEQFLQAHEILINTKDGNENRHHPFKMAQNYVRFYDKFFEDIGESQKRIFLNSCQEILVRIQRYRKVVPKQEQKAVVQTCENEMKRLLELERKWLATSS